MAHWCQGQKTELVIDRGPEGLATTLYQEEPETGFWRPINYCSRTQTKAEQRYSQIEGESLAIQFGVLSNQMYLYSNHFVVVTDTSRWFLCTTTKRNKGQPEWNDIA